MSLKGKTIPREILALVPEDSAIANQIIPFERTQTELKLAMTDPTNFEIINFIEKRTGLIVRPYFTFYNQVVKGLAQYKQDINVAFRQILSTAKTEGTDLAKAAEELPTIKMLDTIMEYAIAKNASDIHIEGQELNTIIRFRVDGILHDILVLDHNVQPLVVARIKYLCNLKIDEHRVPQDGRFKYEHLGSRVSLRVSVIPSFYGENVVMRLLQETSKTLTLEELGFSPKNVETITAGIKRTNGIVLLTGPTGSGKSTTLYSLLEMLNKPEVKISTIEDPIEYSIPRVMQSQVNVDTGFTFASGLRALLRHDPNIIMVGEIRDAETADISINAALTGHLVLSTLHTNDATSSIPRIIDLGIEPFLVTATLRVIVAQRLVRQLCKVCARPVQLGQAEFDDLSKVSGFSVEQLSTGHFKEPQGCKECNNSGYSGRFGIHEVFVLSEEIRNLIHKKPTNDEIRDAAVKAGMITMIQDGVAKAAAGKTSIAEIFREAGRED